MHAHTYGSLDAPDETITSVFLRSLNALPNRTYINDGAVSLSINDVAHRAASFQRCLRDYGVERGDVVTLQLPNWWETIVAMHAVWGLGAIVNPVSHINRGRDLETIFDLSRPKVIVTPAFYRDVDYPSMIAQALAAVDHESAVLTLRDLARPVALLNVNAEFEVVPCDQDDVSMLMYTSGTTGRPKGVLHSHRTLLYESKSIAEIFGLHGDSIFMPSPLAHITGLLYGVLMPLQIGGRVVLMDRWDPAGAVQLIEEYQCTVTVSATPFLRGLADQYAKRNGPSSLHTFICGGADIPANLVAHAKETMGVSVARTYGSTEMPTLCVVRPEDEGEIRLITEGRVIGEARARLTPGSSDIGQLEVHGPELFVGYLDTAENDAAFTIDGWFKTGDLARITATAEVVIVGRLKDVVVRGGENIGTKEIEELLFSHESIIDVAIVGVPDDLMGERACAIVVSRNPELTLADITTHLGMSRIAKQKYPELLLLLPELPRTVSGKIQKFQLREQALRAIELGDVQRR